MRNKHYPNRTIRLAASTWAIFKYLRTTSGISWNLFIRDVVIKKLVHLDEESGQNAHSSKGKTPTMPTPKKENPTNPTQQQL